MKQFLVLLVFTPGKEHGIRHRVLCVVALAFGCSAVCAAAGSIYLKKWSYICACLSFGGVSCAFANASI